MSEQGHGLDRDQWNERLEIIGQSLAQKGVEAALTVVGSAPGILAGQPGRTSMDLDVWRPASDYERRHLKDAVEAAGLLYSPIGYEPEEPYIQMVEPGIVQVGQFKPELVDHYGPLQLSRPPIANLIASKLCRASQADLSDIAWMMGTYEVDPAEIRGVVQSFPYKQRIIAGENLVYLDALRSFAVPPESSTSPDYTAIEDPVPSQLPTSRRPPGGRSKR